MLYFAKKIMVHHYLFTITFDNLKSIKTKTKLIDKLYSLFTFHIDDDAELYYTIEYHKKSDHKSNNYFRPHVHGVLYCLTPPKTSTLECLIDNIKSKYGKILQFSLQEDIDEVKGWLDYCEKDVKQNEEHTNQPHSFIYAIAKQKQTIKDELFQEI